MFNQNLEITMKKIMLNGMLAATFCFWMAACDSPNTAKEDSTEVAEEQNEEKLASDDAEDDADFLVKAASGGMLEVELGKMALQKASSPGVKKFAQQMVNDHGKANEELKALAAKKNITLPTTPGDEAQEHINDLAKYSGAEFDKKYMELMHKDHQEDLDLFKEAAEDAEDAEVKAFAAKTLPVLTSHHKMAEQMEEGTAKNAKNAKKDAAHSGAHN
jgi:putative membrane protein